MLGVRISTDDEEGRYAACVLFCRACDAEFSPCNPSMTVKHHPCKKKPGKSPRERKPVRGTVHMDVNERTVNERTKGRAQDMNKR